MLTIPKYLAAFLAIISLVSCGTISKVHVVQNVKESAKIDFSQYDKIIVLDFKNKTNLPTPIDKEKILITQSFADKIYHHLSESANFSDINLIKTKSKKFIKRKNLVISGDITKSDNGDDILRGIFGIFGRSRLDAKISFMDGGSKKIVAQIDVSKVSLAYGLFVAAHQDLEYLIEVSAKDVADKIKNLKKPLTQSL